MEIKISHALPRTEWVQFFSHRPGQGKLCEVTINKTSWFRSLTFAPFTISGGIFLKIVLCRWIQELALRMTLVIHSNNKQKLNRVTGERSGKYGKQPIWPHLRSGCNPYRKTDKFNGMGSAAHQRSIVLTVILDVKQKWIRVHNHRTCFSVASAGFISNRLMAIDLAIMEVLREFHNKTDFQTMCYPPLAQ